MNEEKKVKEALASAASKGNKDQVTLACDNVLFAGFTVNYNDMVSVE